MNYSAAASISTSRRGRGTSSRSIRWFDEASGGRKPPDSVTQIRGLTPAPRLAGSTRQDAKLERIRADTCGGGRFGGRVDLDVVPLSPGDTKLQDLLALRRILRQQLLRVIV